MASTTRQCTQGIGALSTKDGVLNVLLSAGSHRFVGADDRANSYGQFVQPLHAAAWDGDLRILQVLLVCRHFNLEARDRDGDTPLVRAVSQGEAEVVKALLDEGANLETTNDNEMTPIHFACEIQDLDMVLLLIERGACVHSKDKMEKTRCNTLVWVDAKIHGRLFLC